jgi:catechol 2,3-dioxygenase-like lactoylglutathione lyase family enzyme
MPQSIAHIALVVRDYDEAIAFYTQALGFELIEDSASIDRNGQEKRWVLVGPAGSRGTNLLLAQAFTPEEDHCIGNQTGGRVFLFLHTDDFWRDYRAMTGRGVKFVREPKEEPYGTVAVFEDLYGNQWDLLQRKDSKAQSS